MWPSTNVPVSVHCSASVGTMFGCIKVQLWTDFIVVLVIDWLGLKWYHPLLHDVSSDYCASATNCKVGTKVGGIKVQLRTLVLVIDWI